MTAPVHELHKWHLSNTASAWLLLSFLFSCSKCVIDQSANSVYSRGYTRSLYVLL